MIRFKPWFDRFLLPLANLRLALLRRKTAETVSENLKTKTLPDDRTSEQKSPQPISRQLIAAQEAERRRIARELHDELGGALTALKINLDVACRALPEDSSAKLRSSIHEARALAVHTLEAARNLALELRPAMLDDLGLEAALRWAIDRYEGRTGQTIHFKANLAKVRLQPALEVTLYRIINEALTNIARHAQADSVWVTLSLEKKTLLARVQDNGRGFEIAPSNRPEEPPYLRPDDRQSMGLISMRERAALLNGTLEIVSQPGRGTIVEARFPLGE